MVLPLFGVVVVIAALICTLIASIFALRKKDGGLDEFLDELGVKQTYSGRALPFSKIEAYMELKDKLRRQYAKSSPEPLWMSQLPLEAKDMLKYHLMQRAIGDMATWQKIDVDVRGYWKLFSKGMITRTFWNSVVKAEKDLSEELESVKAEAASVEPGQDPQGIISEAMQFIMRYGDKLPSAADVAGSQDAINDLMRQLPRPGGQGGMPGMPSLGQGGAGVPGMPGPHGPPPQLAPGVQAAVEATGYNWRQEPTEIEVTVDVPDTAKKAEIKVTFKLRSLRVEHAGAALVEGQLAGNIRPEECTWTLSKGRVVVTMEKADQRAWQTLIVEPK